MILGCSWINLQFNPNVRVLEYLHCVICVICLISFIFICIFDLEMILLLLPFGYCQFAWLLWLIHYSLFVNVEVCLLFCPIILPTAPDGNMIIASWFWVLFTCWSSTFSVRFRHETCFFFAGWLCLWSLTFVGIVFCVRWFPRLLWTVCFWYFFLIIGVNSIRFNLFF